MINECCSPGGIQMTLRTADGTQPGIVRDMRLCRSLTRNLRWGPGERGRLVAQRSSAVRTIDIIYANHALALRTARAQFVVAARAEVESRLHGVPTLWTGRDAWLPQYEIQHDAERVRDEHREQGPTQSAHSAATGITVHIPDHK